MTTPSRGRSGLLARLPVVAALVALVPIGLAAARAVARHWLPLGDHAFFAIRARDVFSANVPLLGTGSSASIGTGTELNHPGPLFFDALALPVRLLGDGPGLAVGVAVINGLAVVGIAVVAHRRGGPLLATLATAVTAGLAWAMGSELLYEPWQPHTLLLPFLCYVMLAWSLARGDVVMLPWVAGLGSFVLQTHLSYGLLVPTLAAWAVVGLVVHLRRKRDQGPGSWSHVRTRARRAVAAAVVVLALCWAQPLLEQLTSDGAGNFTRLARSFGSDERATLGLDMGARLLTALTTVPPWWLRPSFRRLGSVGWQPPSLGLAAASLAMLAVVLVGCAWLARRRRDPEGTYLLATAGLVLVAGLASVARIPVVIFGAAAGHFSFLWPVAAFVAFAVAASVARALTANRKALVGPLVVALTVVTGVLAALNLPTSDQGAAATTQLPSTSRSLGRQLAVLEGEGPLLVDLRAVPYLDYYGPAVMGELRRRDIDFAVDDPELVRQLGTARRFRGDNARARLSVVIGDLALTAPPGSRRVAFLEGLTGAQRLERAELERDIATFIRDRGLPLNRQGRAAIEKLGVTEADELPVRPGDDPAKLLASRDLVGLVRNGFLTLSEDWSQRFERYAELVERSDRHTVALFLTSLPGAAGSSP